jgi:phospholipid/cholesterol/gamma-HCH transport system substrate-binding protein
VNYALVGGFVLVLGTALVGVVLWLASGGALQKKYDLYLAIEEEPVAGLNLNAPVKYNGVDVGKVRSIKLDPANPEHVRLVFGIERGTPVNQDTLAVLKTQGLTGIAYVELEGGGRDSAPLRAPAPGQYPEIRTKPSLSARLENVLTSVLAKLDQTSNNLNAVLSDENRAAFTQTLTDIAAVAHTLAARQTTIDAAIAGAAHTFDNSEHVTAQLGPVVEQIKRSAEAVQHMGDEAALASNSARKTVDSVGTDVKRITAETLPEFQRLMTELRALSTSLRRLSDQTERNRSGLLFGGSSVPEGPGESSKGQPP